MASTVHMAVYLLVPQEEAAWAQVNLGGAALREARAELAEARKQWHALQVEIETLYAMVRTVTNNAYRHYFSSVKYCALCMYIHKQICNHLCKSYTV